MLPDTPDPEEHGSEADPTRRARSPYFYDGLRQVFMSANLPPSTYSRAGRGEIYPRATNCRRRGGTDFDTESR
jgi:hypothetical protein